MKILVLGVLALGTLCGCASAQSTEGEIAARLMGKPLQLRGFWMDDKLKFDADGSPLQPYRTGSFTETGFEAQSIRLSGDHLKIQGQRVAITFNEEGIMSREPLFMGEAFGRKAEPDKVIIEIDGNHNKDFTKALDAVFAPSIAELANSLPDYWQPFVRKRFGADRGAEGKVVGASTDDTAEKPFGVGGDVKPPVVLHQVDPIFSGLARVQKYSGSVLVQLWVEKDGSVSHVTLERPSGMGLDEPAVAAVKQYRFAPATKDGVPVKVEIRVDVNFHIS